MIRAISLSCRLLASLRRDLPPASRRYLAERLEYVWRSWGVHQ